jgi:hypothetical protein
VNVIVHTVEVAVAMAVLDGTAVLEGMAVLVKVGTRVLPVGLGGMGVLVEVAQGVAGLTMTEPVIPAWMEQ